MMINISSRSEDWIRGIQGEYKTDPMLLEKAILALSLLEQLKISGLEFIFKGGTALILLLNKLNRLSIDIDIIIETQKKEQNEKIFDSVIQLETFIRVEKNDRESDKNIPKAHYKFYYQSVISKKEEYVLLDILYEKNLYCTLQDIKILSKLIVCDDVITMVKVPSINCILGDKLTAFAPNTTGIPYNKDKEMEIIKQLFDVACLFDKSDNINDIADSFNKIANHEIEYRKSNITPEDVLLDIFTTSLVIALRGKKDPEQFNALLSGIRKIKTYILNFTFTIDTAILCASKASYLSMVLLTKSSRLELFTGTNTDSALSLNILNPEFSKLNKLKKIDLEAFYYFFKAVELYEKTVK